MTGATASTAGGGGRTSTMTTAGACNRPLPIVAFLPSIPSASTPTPFHHEADAAGPGLKSRLRRRRRRYMSQAVRTLMRSFSSSRKAVALAQAVAEAEEDGGAAASPAVSPEGVAACPEVSLAERLRWSICQRPASACLRLLLLMLLRGRRGVRVLGPLRLCLPRRPWGYGRGGSRRVWWSRDACCRWLTDSVQ